MKKKILLLMGIFSLGLLQAQVGINTNTPKAALDILSVGNSVSTKAIVVKNHASNSIFELRDNGQFFTSGITTSPILLDLRNGIDNSIIAMGNSTQTASAAKGGAVKYDTNTRALYLSDGSAWNELASDYIKAFVVADVNTVVNIPNNSASNFVVKPWRILADNSGSFNSSTGVFKALRGGIYAFTVNMTLNSGPITAPSDFRLEITSSTGQEIKSITTFHGSGTSYASAQCSANLYLNINETVSVSLWHDLGATKQIELGYNNLTVVEL